jgi:hypothetical protein
LSPASSDDPGDNGSGSTGSRSKGGGDCGSDCSDDSGDDNGGYSVTPGTFSKTSPADGATGQPATLTLNWSVSSSADHYEYCVDTTNNSKSGNGCSASSPSNSWATTRSTAATVSGLQSGKIYYWQVRAADALDDAFMYASRAWFSFTVA